MSAAKAPEGNSIDLAVVGMEPSSSLSMQSLLSVPLLSHSSNTHSSSLSLSLYLPFFLIVLTYECYNLSTLETPYWKKKTIFNCLCGASAIQVGCCYRNDNVLEGSALIYSEHVSLPCLHSEHLFEQLSDNYSKSSDQSELIYIRIYYFYLLI